MLEELNGIVNQTLRERIDKSVVGKLINAKVMFGLAAPIKAKEIVKCTDDLAEELYKPVKRKFQRRRVNVNSIDEIVAADLMELQAFSKDTNGIKYLLTVIDIFSNFCLHCFLKMENRPGSCKCISRILTERRPSKVWVDKVGNSIIKTSKNWLNSSRQKRRKILCD